MKVKEVKREVDASRKKMIVTKKRGVVCIDEVKRKQFRVSFLFFGCEMHAMVVSSLSAS